MRDNVHIPDVVISVAQKLSKNIDGQNTESVVRRCFHDSQDGFVQNRVTDIL